MTSPARSVENFLARFRACRCKPCRNRRNGRSSGAMTAQVGHDVVVTTELGQMYGRVSIRCQRVDLCSGVHKMDDALEAAIFGSHVQRRLRFRQLIWIGPIVEQQLDDLSVSTLVGGVEWRSLPTDGQVDVRPTLDQKLCHLGISAFAGDVERRNAVNFVDSGATVQGGCHRCDVALLDKIAQGAGLGRQREKPKDPRSPCRPHESPLDHRILPEAVRSLVPGTQQDCVQFSPKQQFSIR